MCLLYVFYMKIIQTINELSGKSRKTIFIYSSLTYDGREKQVSQFFFYLRIGKRKK